MSALCLFRHQNAMIVKIPTSSVHRRNTTVPGSPPDRTLPLDLMAQRPKRVLAISSSGGHWVQLLRVRPAFEGHEIVYSSVRAEDAVDVAPDRFLAIPDATRWDRLRFAWMTMCVALLLVRVRPDVVISTGAAPGYVAVRLARYVRARTIWLDSVANAEEVSMSGRRIGPRADLWLTQWPELAGADGPTYAGSVL